MTIPRVARITPTLRRRNEEDVYLTLMRSHRGHGMFRFHVGLFQEGLGWVTWRADVEADWSKAEIVTHGEGQLVEFPACDIIVPERVIGIMRRGGWDWKNLTREVPNE